MQFRGISVKRGEEVVGYHDYDERYHEHYICYNKGGNHIKDRVYVKTLSVSTTIKDLNGIMIYASFTTETDKKTSGGDSIEIHDTVFKIEFNGGVFQGIRIFDPSKSTSMIIGSGLLKHSKVICREK